MEDTYQSYRVFLSSPGDVSDERDLAEKTIGKINKNCIENLRVLLDIKKWEDIPPRTPTIPEEKIQDVINKEVERSHFFILILFKRYGSIEDGHSKSNTEREIDTILKEFEKRPQIKILSYFRDIPENHDPGEQEKKVAKLKEKLQGLGIFHKSYNTPEEFNEKLTHDLYDVIMRMKLSSFKQYRLKRIFKFGVAERPTKPRTAIIYPSVQREYMGNVDDEKLWLKRLEPNIFFEDFKALQKFHKMFSIIGFGDYRIYTHLCIPSENKFMNRIWLCYPRLIVAQEQLKNYNKITRFSFIPRS